MGVTVAVQFTVDRHAVTPDAVTESVERRLPVQKVERSNPNQVKPMTYQIGTVVGVMQMGNIVPKEGIEPTSLC